MPESFLKRHRTICAVLEELRKEIHEDPKMLVYRKEQLFLLIDEAKDYAQRMSVRLNERKQQVAELEGKLNGS